MKYIVSSVEFLDNKKAKVKLSNGFTFALYNREIKKYLLYENNLIDDENLNNIKTVLYNRGKERALFLLGGSSKTKKYISDKLLGAYYPKEIVDEIIDFLEKYNFINDKKYAYMFVEYNSNRKSARIIRNDLLKKGICRELVDEVLSELYIDEKSSIRQLIESKTHIYNINEEGDKRKLINFLLRKGYSYELIKKELRNKSVYDECEPSVV